MGVTLSGLGSGLDWRSIVDQLIALDRIQIDDLEDDKTINDAEISAINSIGDQMDDLQSALDALNDTDAFYGRTYSLGDSESTVLSAYVEPSTLTGDYEFTIQQLATETTRVGTSDITNSLASTSDVSGVTVGTMSTALNVTEGTFTVNGAEVTLETTDSLQDVFDAISTATGGDVTASYDSSTDTITLVSGSGDDVVLGSPTDTSNFLVATKLYSNGTSSVSSTSSLGALRMADSLEDANFATALSGSGTIAINGVEIDYESTDSITSVIQAINNSDAGVTASYDGESDQITLRNNATGSFGLTVTDVSGNLGEALGIATGGTVTLGVNAEFTLNGGSTLISNSNNLTSDTHGVDGLTVTAEELGTETVTVSVDNSDAKTKIETFITEYNELIDYLETQTDITVNDDGEIDTGLLSDNREMSAAISELRRALVTSTSGSNVKRLQDMGIDFESGTNRLEIDDETLLDEALEDFASEVDEVFNDDTDGLFAQLEAVLDGYTEDDAIIETQTDSLNKQNDDIDIQIDQLERYIAQREQSMIDSFLAMEQAQQEINNQLQAISQIT